MDENTSRIIKGGPFQGRFILCECGYEVELLDGLDNFCEECDRCYNIMGQLVLPSRDPRVEEPYDDDY